MQLREMLYLRLCVYPVRESERERFKGEREEGTIEEWGRDRRQYYKLKESLKFANRKFWKRIQETWCQSHVIFFSILLDSFNSNVYGKAQRDWWKKLRTRTCTCSLRIRGYNMICIRMERVKCYQTVWNKGKYVTASAGVANMLTHPHRYITY